MSKYKLRCQENQQTCHQPQDLQPPLPHLWEDVVAPAVPRWEAVAALGAMSPWEDVVVLGVPLPWEAAARAAVEEAVARADAMFPWEASVVVTARAARLTAAPVVTIK